MTETKRYVFEGGSDDTFGEYSITQDDYDNCASGEPIRWKLSLPDGSGLLVVGVYATNALVSPADGWMIGVATLLENRPVDWPVMMEPSHGGYRNRLIVEAPVEARLVCLTREEDIHRSR